jgi:tetratricopeptide (TPR) repeat protein
MRSAGRIGILLCALVAVIEATAQNAVEKDAYKAALNQSDPPARIQALERFVHAYETSPLLPDALAMLVWEYSKTGPQWQSARWAKELTKFQPDNALAMAALSREATTQSSEPPLDLALRGLRSVEQLRRPDGIDDKEFYDLVRETRAQLNFTAGQAYLVREDFITARKYLKEAVALFPNNGQYAYAAALAHLQGQEPDGQRGYWLLARAVVLSQGTPQGEPIAKFARERYKLEGGDDARWNQFLAVANAGAPPLEPKAPEVAAARSGEKVVRTVPKAKPAPVETARVDAEPLDVPPLPKRPEETPVVAEPTGPKAPPQRKGAPVSLGILIASRVATRENRTTVIYALSDMVRRLREDDEAFIVSMGTDVGFEQDLTWNYELLERAMERITPHEGTSLMDAVAFGAGHLARIAKNQNRVLLVVSDAVDEPITTSQLPSDLKVSGARVLGIGIGMSSGNGGATLQRLAKDTGGKALFVSDASRFREAARSVATDLGMSLP